MFPYVIILTEIWINYDEHQLYNISEPNYTSYIKNNEDHRAGGIILYVKTWSDIICDLVIFQTADIFKLEIKCNLKLFFILAKHMKVA